MSAQDDKEDQKAARRETAATQADLATAALLSLPSLL
jgi:hypothetical protein